MSRFQQYWLAEAVRLRESQWGPLQDSQETRRARTDGDSFTRRLLLRAIYLGQREGLDVSVRQWAGGARLTFFVLLFLAALTGAGAALGALGDGTRQVNLGLALTALLGLHGLTFLLWGISGVLPSGTTSRTGLGELWLWMTRKLARGPHAALILRALAGMLSRQGALRSLTGAVSHALWSCALTAMLVTLIALLSARRYTFNWETTLLSSDTFVWLTKTLGWLPSKLGFSIPPEMMIRASDGLHTLPANAHALWSGWLIGCLVCYGLLPRLLALAATSIMTGRHIKRLALDTTLPGYIELRDRLEPLSVPGGIDAPAPAVPAVRHRPSRPPKTSTRHAIVGLELPHDEHWPPIPLASHVTDLGMIDDRTQRRHLLDTLQTEPLQKLLIVCDGRQTPDRGVLALISELAELAQDTYVTLMSDAGNTAAGPEQSEGITTAAERLNTWTEQLKRTSLSKENIVSGLAHVPDWLNTPLPDSPAGGTPSPDSAP